jgi:hypothetical protein
LAKSRTKVFEGSESAKGGMTFSMQEMQGKGKKSAIPLRMHI